MGKRKRSLPLKRGAGNQQKVKRNGAVLPSGGRGWPESPTGKPKARKGKKAR